MKSIPENQFIQNPAGHSDNEAPRESLWEEYKTILKTGKRTILITLCTVFCAVTLYTFITKPTYEASSLVLVDVKGKGSSLVKFDITGTATANKITNELEILKSNANKAAIAQALLSKRYIDNDTSAKLSIIKASDDNVSADSVASETSVMERLSESVEFIPIRESDIIRITARSTSPKEAAFIANVYTQIYTARNLNTSRLESQVVREFLQDQLHSKRNALDTDENKLQTYMQVSGVVSLDAEANKVVEQLSQLEAQRNELEVEKSTRLNTLSSYKEELARQEPNAAKAIGESNDSYIRLLQEQLAKLEVQRDVGIAQNPGMVDEKLYSDKLGEINNQISSLKKRLHERTEVYLNSLLPGGLDPGSGNALFLAQIKQKIIEQQIELSGFDASINALNSVIGDCEKKFNQIPRKSIELARLQRARLSSEKLYLFVEEKYNEAAIKEKSEFGYVNIIDPAIVPVKQVSPRVALNLILGFLVGLGLGAGIVFIRAFVDTRIRRPEDLKRCGFIPLTAIGVMDAEVRKVEQELASSGGNYSFNSHLISHYRPLAPIAESYRHLRTNLQYLQVDNQPRCLVVTSANPKEGKTTTISNLAISFSQVGKNVLLVDADMRRHRIHSLFGLKDLLGLSEYLFGKASIDDIIQKQILKGLDIIVCGMPPPNPAEILGSNKMKNLIAQMKQAYDIVLFDSPPLLTVTDASVLATETDGVLLIASAGSTQANELVSIAEFLSSIGVRIFGVVLNNFNIRKAYGGYNSSYHYGYYAYESGYYQKDGEEETKKSVKDFLKSKVKRKKT